MCGEEEEKAFWRRAWYGICEEGALGDSEVGESGWVKGGVEDVDGLWWCGVRGRGQRFKHLEGR